MDNQERQDATGGWHEACDLRKWVDATLYVMLGLGAPGPEVRAPEWDSGQLLEELRWGNRYFLHMREPLGHDPE